MYDGVVSGVQSGAWGFLVRSGEPVAMSDLWRGALGLLLIPVFLLWFCVWLLVSIGLGGWGVVTGDWGPWDRWEERLMWRRCA